MSNPFETTGQFDDIEQTSVKEGLICPICMKDFRSVRLLQDHFSNHANDEELTNEANIDLTNKKITLKTFFDKAKRILKNEDEYEHYNQNDQRKLTNYQLYDLSENQELGHSKSHFEYFRTIRDKRIERYFIETNKLLIRLDRLMKEMPQDPERRKLVEQSIVKWANDEDVRLCPTCAKSFGLRRRRHHCRLCGAIMCQACSMFLDFDYANKLIAPTNLDENYSSNSNGFVNNNLNFGFTGGLTRRGSNSSLLSMVNSAGEPHIRVCCDCKALLDRRNNEIEKHTSRPLLFKLYDQLIEQFKETDKIIPIYLNMSESINRGETNYKLNDAQDLRMKIAKSAEGIDLLSKRISAFGMKNADENKLTPKQVRLQMNIRLMAKNYIKDNLLSLPSLPNEQEFLEKQEMLRAEIEKKIEEEKRLTMMEAARSSASSSTLSPSSSKMNKISSSSSLELVTPETGWDSGEVATNSQDFDAMDPIQVQINIIKKYIKKARRDHKYDEVHILESNLKELEIDYMLKETDCS